MLNFKANDAGRSPYTEYTDVCGGQQDTELFHVFVKKGFSSLLSLVILEGGKDSILLNSHGKNTVNGHKTHPSLSSKHNYKCISKLETISPFEFFFSAHAGI